MLRGKIRIGQRFFNAILNLLGGLFQLHGAQFCHHRFRLFAGSFLALLRVNRLEHLGNQLHLGFRHNREDVSIKMHHTALVLGLREHFAHGLQHPQALVSDDEFYAVQSAPSKPLK